MMKPSPVILRLLLGFVVTWFANVAMAGYPLVANQGKRLCWFDASGNLVGQMTLRAAPHDIHVLPSGNVLTHQGTEVIEIDAESREIIWSFDTKALASAEKVELHSVGLLANGDLMVALSGEGKLFEIDRKGVVNRTFDFKLEHPHPHRDTRLVRLVPRGDQWSYLVAHEGDGMVREYDRDGGILWEYDVPMFGKKPKGGHGPDAFGDAVFSALRLPNGNTLIGTGNGHSVLEVTPEKEIVWQVHQDDIEGVRLAWVTTLQPRSNGNLIIGNCHAGPDQPQLVEIDRNKSLVWSFRDFRNLGNAVSNSVVDCD
ncbi:MAG: PQQ-binding-like beta-propeller repeat protein [Planctomycetota bacterium]